MKKEDNINNVLFALRKEYFGGLLLDYKRCDFVILNYHEFSFLNELIVQKSILINEKISTKLIKTLEKLKIININSSKITLLDKIRKIPDKNMSLKSYLSAPLKVYDTYTNQCNLACSHCYASAKPNFTEKRRTIAETRRIIKKFYKIGVMEWNFTGGEPSTASDLFKSIDIAKEFNMKVTLNTNGCWSNMVYKDIANHKIDTIVISLDGDEKLHDERRGRGTFKKVLKTLNFIKNHNSNWRPKVILNVSIGRDNITCIDFVINLAVEYGHDIKFVPIRAGGRASKGLVLCTEEYRKFANTIYTYGNDHIVKKRGIKISLNHQNLFSKENKNISKNPYPFNFSQCTALTTSIDILPDGKVVACSFVMGNKDFTGMNIKNKSVYSAWNDPKMQKFRESEKEKCKTCKFYKKRCRGVCRSNILLNGGSIASGKIIGEDVYCFRDLL